MLKIVKICLAACALLFPLSAQAADLQDFLRFVPLPLGHEQLQTAVVHYTGPHGTTVDLVAAVHIADRGYYQQLQKRLDAFPKLLYELIAPEDFTAADMAQRPKSGVTSMQLWMKETLGLTFQLDEINYNRKNFVHADLDGAAMAKAMMDKPGETLGSMVHWALADSTRWHYRDGSLRLGGLELFAQWGRGRKPTMKLFLARELSEMDGDFGMQGGAMSELLVQSRNAKAIEVLQKMLAGGTRKIGIFYGAAHLPDFEKRLTGLGFVRGKTTWLTAWDLHDDK